MTTIDTIDSPAQRKAGPDALTFAGWMSAAGSLSVVVVCIFYVMSPRPAANPVQPLDVAAAMPAAVSGARTLHAAGLVGVLGDLLWAAAVLLLAGELTRRGRGVAAMGWYGLFLSILIFTLVDGMTGFVMTPLAMTGDAAAYEGMKRLWDMLFLVGVVAYGGGVALAMGADLASGEPMVARPLAGLVLAIAAVGGAAGAAGIMGAAADRIAGGSILPGAILLIPVSLQIARAGRVPHRGFYNGGQHAEEA
jgi:hypothetical protein